MSWKPEVIADESKKWCPNGLAFERKEDAEAWVADLACRWILVRETRVVESDEPVNRPARAESALSDWERARGEGRL